MRGRLSVALIATALVGLSGMTWSAEAADREVSVSKKVRDKTVPCPALERVGSSRVRGGCVVGAEGDNIDFTILTVVRRLMFGSCSFYYTMHVDSEGQLVVTDVGISGNSPCNDVMPCFEQDHERRVPLTYPRWEGYIAPGEHGKLRATIYACLDTCMGRFEGKLVLDVKRHKGRWQTVADGAMIGVSGWSMGGNWSLGAPGFLSSGPPNIDIRVRRP